MRTSRAELPVWPEVWRPLNDVTIARTAHRGYRSTRQRRIPVLRRKPLSGATHTRSGQLAANISNLTQVFSSNWDLPIIMNTNLHGGLASKLDEIHCVCTHNNVSVACLTETWCKSDVVDDAPLSMPGFSLHKRDKQNGCQHGGVVCFIKETIPVKEWPELNDEHLEVLWLTIRPRRLPRQLSHLNIGTVYHPTRANDARMSKYLIECLDTILRSHPHTGIMLCGDFNRLNDLYLLKAHTLSQLVKKPTRAWDCCT